MCIDWDDLEPEDYEQPEPQEVDEDHILMTCRECGKRVYFGDVFHGKGGCVFCGPKKDERERAEKIARLRSDAEQKVAEFEEWFYAKHPETL